MQCYYYRALHRSDKKKIMYRALHRNDKKKIMNYLSLIHN